MDELVISATEWMDLAPWRDRAVLLLRVHKNLTSQAWTIAGKKALLSGEGGQVFAVWSGQYRASARYLTVAQQRKILALL